MVLSLLQSILRAGVMLLTLIVLGTLLVYVVYPTASVLRGLVSNSGAIPELAEHQVEDKAAARRRKGSKKL